MPRLTSPSPDHDHIGDVLDAADAWRDQCFMTDGSLFGEEALWTITNIQVLKELTSRVIDYPIEGEDFSFPEQIEESLKSAPSEVIRLAAEAVWLLLLCPRHGSATPNSKRERIRKIWDWSGSNLQKNGLLDDRVLVGVKDTGKLIIFNGFLVGAGAQHCQGQIRQRDRFATTMTIPTRNGDFGATRAGSKWPAPRAHSTACPNA